jgi:hypothetical protein
MYLLLLILIRANLRVAQPSVVSTFVPDKSLQKYRVEPATLIYVQGSGNWSEFDRRTVKCGE